MKKIRFGDRKTIFNVIVTALSITASVGIMLYGVSHFGLRLAWLELILNIFYIACLVMIWAYFFYRITTEHFNYWCSIALGITVLLRDILFTQDMAYYYLQLICLTLSVLLLCMLTYFMRGKTGNTIPRVICGRYSSLMC